MQPGPPLSVSAPIRDSTINWMTVAVVAGVAIVGLIVILGLIMLVGALFAGGHVGSHS